MSKQFFDSPIFTDTEDDVFFRQKMRMGLSDIASVISLLQDDFNKQISSVRSSILLPSSTLGGNVTLSPATATRNVILPTAVGATNLVLKAIASQTAKALEIQSSAGAVVGSVTVAGVIASMTWNGVTIGTTYGGTGLTSYTAGDTLYSSAADTLAKLPKGTADQLYGMNAGATIPEWKGVTVTLAGAMAGVTTLGAVGPVTLSAGGISVADTYGMYSSISSTDRNVIRRNSTTLEVGVNGGWTGATYTIASGSHVFAIGAINYFQCSTSLFQTAIDAQINGTFRATGAGQFDSTLLTTGTARFSSRVGIGGASNSAFTLYVTGSGLMSGTEQTGVSVDVTGASDGTAVGRGLYARFNTAAASYTVAIVNVLEAAVPVIGAGSAITDLRGVVINGMTGATNNYGLFIEAIAGGTINRAIHTAGGDHVFVGNVRIGSTTAATVALDVTGAALISSTLGVTGTLTGATANFSGIVTSTATGGGGASGLQVVAAGPSVGWNITGGGVDAKQWDMVATGSTLLIRTVNDANNASAIGIQLTRSANTITDVSLGNATNNPTGNWLGTGAFTFGSRVGIGPAPNASIMLDIGGGTSAAGITGTTQYGAMVRPLFGTGATTNMTTLDLRGKGADGTYVTTTQVGLRIESFVKGSSQTVTNAYGIYMDAVSHGGTLNYALFTNAGLVNLGDTTDATSTITGGTQVKGGLSVVKALWVGGLADIAGALTVTGLITANGGITLGSAQVFQGGATAAGHAFGATSASSWLVVSPTSFTSSAALGSIAIVTGTINGAASNSVSVFRTVGTIVEAGSGVHPILAGAYFGAPTITAGVATATDAATVYVAAATSATVTGFNYGILSESVIASRLGGLASGGNAGLTVRAANPAITLIENDQTTDETVWAFFLNSKVLRGRLYSDDVASNVDWLAVTRGTGVVVSDVAFSNSTDNAPVRILATTDATSISTGSQRTAGGASVTKALWVGGLIDVAGASKIAGNAAFFGTGSFGSGTGVMSIINASVNPSANPTGGGILYSDAGALKWRGSSGTTTTIAAA